MQTKVILIFAICSLQVIAACTRPKSTNEQVPPEITSVSESLNVADAPEAASTNVALVEDTTPQVAPSETAPQPIQEAVVEKKATAKSIKKVDMPEATPQVASVVDTAVLEQKVQEKEPAKLPSPPAHTIWDKLLRRYVSHSGKVNYKGLKGEKALLNNYTQLLSNNPPEKNWSRNQRLAYWINVYNAYTVKLILDNYPLKSITDLDKPWDQKIIPIGDKTYSLNQVENEIIRPRFNEPRIHFAVNCAAKSCPPLLNEAFVSEKLNAQLQKQTKAFLNNATSNSISSNEIKLSKIFDWYKADFNNLINFVNTYTETEINADAKISFLAYDWALNE